MSEIQAAASPGQITISDAEALQFVHEGRMRLTALGVSLRNLREWAEVFEQRGGAESYGNDALAMVYLNNEMQQFATTEKQSLFARLRTDM